MIFFEEVNSIIPSNFLIVSGIILKTYKNTFILYIFLQKIYTEYELQGLEEDKLQCGQYQVNIFQIICPNTKQFKPKLMIIS